MSASVSFISDQTTGSGFDDLQNPKYAFTGKIGEDGLRTQYGCQTWNDPQCHKFAGSFFYNNLHGRGFYFIEEENSCSFFDGQFYNNKIEGYGLMINQDGSSYEGLFKENRRFGPGIVSHPDGTQDVGLWNGNSLIRLSISLSSGTVPTLCTSHSSRIKLLRFRKIVPACPERKDLAKITMQRLRAGEKLMGRYPELYNTHVRNENSLFFDRRIYDLEQLGSENCQIEVLDEDFSGDSIFDKVSLENDECPCRNARCIQINKQIDEIDSKLRKVTDIRQNYEKQLQICQKCCRINLKTKQVEHENSIGQSDTDDTALSEEIKHPSMDMSTKTGVTKNFDVMKTGTSITDLNGLASKDVQKPKVKETDSINRIYINKTNFPSDLSVDISEKDNSNVIIDSQTTCVCAEEEIPNIDYLLSELKRLKRSEKFFQTVLDFLNNILYKETTSTSYKSNPKTVKIHVEDLLAWNNETIPIEILQYCFRYRESESILSYNMKSLLIGDRCVFGKVGNYEKICVNYFKHCEFNQLNEVMIDLLQHNVNPDLTDGRGNSGLHFAVSKDCHSIIGILANLGANLDIMNDECLTPLTLSILRYIALLNGVVIWEKAFLADVVLTSRELDQVTQWRPHESLITLSEFMLTSTSGIAKEQRKPSSDEISTKIRSRLLSVRSNSLCSKLNMNYLLSTTFIEDPVRVRKAPSAKKSEELSASKLNKIEETISTLLHYGADPNYGEVPINSILLAIYTKNVDIVEKILSSHANPNTLNDDGLSALHILACLPFTQENSKLVELFIKYSCDLNLKTKSHHWIEQNEDIIGNYFNAFADNEDYQGKTALQLIAMRKDFDEENIDHQCAMAASLLRGGASPNSHFLGHTVLSLAALRGNVRLLETIIPFVDLYQPLGENMGNVLTLLGLHRFPSIITLNDSKLIIDKLVSYGGNPFNQIYNFSNIFEFFYSDSGENFDFSSPKSRASYESEYSSLRKIVLSDHHDLLKNCNKLTVAYWKEIGRKILTKIYQYKAIQNLFLFRMKDSLNHKCVENMAKLFTIDEALDCMKMLIYNQKYCFDSLNDELILEVLSFIQECTSPVKVKNKTNNKIKIPPIDLKQEIEKLHHEFKVPTYYCMYVLDTNPEKYDVCFHCLRKKTDSLICCPCCGIVKFCSEVCNRFNNKLSTKHSCNICFYDNLKSKSYVNDTNVELPPTGIDLLMIEAKKLRNEERRAEEMKKESDEEEIPKSPSKKSIRRIHKSTPSFPNVQACFKNALDKSTSISFLLGPSSIEETKTSIFSEKASSILISGISRSFNEPRALNCGFHCGQVIPDVQLDSKGSIIREQEFCVCYPLYRDESFKEDLVWQSMQPTILTVSEYLDGISHLDEIKQVELEQLDRFMGHFERETEEESDKLDEAENSEMKHEEDGKELQNDSTKQKSGKNKENRVSLTGPIEDVQGKKGKKKKGEKRNEGDEKRNTGDSIEVGKSTEKLKNKHEKIHKDHKEKRPKERGSGEPSNEEELKKTQEKKRGKKLTSDTNLDESHERDKNGKKTKHDKSKKIKITGQEDSDARVDRDSNKRKKGVAKKSKLSDKSDEEIGADKTKSSDVLWKNDKKRKKEKTRDQSVGDSKKEDKKTMTKQVRKKTQKVKRTEKETQAGSKSSRDKKEGESIGVNPESKKERQQAKDRKRRKGEATEKKRTHDKQKKGQTTTDKKSQESERPHSKQENKKTKTDSQGKILPESIIPSSQKRSAPFDIIRSKFLNTGALSAIQGYKPEESKRISRLYQYFLELITEYFPEFDLNCFLLPFSCFSDGQLYYKFSDPHPYFCRTYSTI